MVDSSSFGSMSSAANEGNMERQPMPGCPGLPSDFTTTPFDPSFFRNFTQEGTVRDTANFDTEPANVVFFTPSYEQVSHPWTRSMHSKEYLIMNWKCTGFC